MRLIASVLLCLVLLAGVSLAENYPCPENTKVKLYLDDNQDFIYCLRSAALKKGGVIVGHGYVYTPTGYHELYFKHSFEPPYTVIPEDDQ